VKRADFTETILDIEREKIGPGNLYGPDRRNVARRSACRFYELVMINIRPGWRLSKKNSATGPCLRLISPVPSRKVTAFRRLGRENFCHINVIGQGTAIAGIRK
jgi:hypothetical protein